MTFAIFEQRRTREQQPPDGWSEALASVDAARNAARAAIGDTERIMRDELASL
jgi:hypothetical protein